MEERGESEPSKLGVLRSPAGVVRVERKEWLGENSKGQPPFSQTPPPFFLIPNASVIGMREQVTWREIDDRAGLPFALPGAAARGCEW